MCVYVCVCLVVQGTYEGDSPFDPVSLTLICRQFHCNYIVGRMAGSGECPYKKTQCSSMTQKKKFEMCVFFHSCTGLSVSEPSNVSAQGAGYVLWGGKYRAALHVTGY